MITAGRVTVGEPHPGAGSSPLGTQALIREARQRQRRRWRRRGLVGVSLALLAAAAVTGAVGLSGPAARLPVRTAAPAPPGPAAAMPSRLVVCTAWAADGTPRAVLAGHQDGVNGVAIAPDGSWLATASDDGTARTWAADGTPRAVTAIRIDGQASDCSWFASGTDLCIAGQLGLYRFSLQAPPG